MKELNSPLTVKETEQHIGREHDWCWLSLKPLTIVLLTVPLPHQRFLAGMKSHSVLRASHREPF